MAYTARLIGTTLFTADLPQLTAVQPQMSCLTPPCKGNLTIRTQESNTCKETKVNSLNLNKRINSYLARENQREYSKVPFARPRTMY
jgi:hypothetical protein